MFLTGRLWKTELQRLADDTAPEISVCHFPRSMSTWNNIEHRVRSFIAQNRRGRPLVSYEVIINSIAATTTDTGLAQPHRPQVRSIRLLTSMRFWSGRARRR